MSRARRLILAATVFAAGCTLATEFWAKDDGTPVLSFGAPSGYARSGFGAVVAALQVDLGGADGRTTFLAASAGIGSASETYRWATQEGLVSDRHLESLCSPLSAAVDDVEPDRWGTCDSSGSGAALLWLRNYGPTATGCPDALLVGQPLVKDLRMTEPRPEYGRILVHCPSGGTWAAVSLAAAPDPPSRLGRAFAAIPLPAADSDRVAVGSRHRVYITAGPIGPAAVWRQLLVTNSYKEGGFGATVVSGRTDDGAVFLAVGSPPEPEEPLIRSRLFIFRPVDAGSPADTDYAAAACTEAAAGASLGRFLAAGDVTRDGNDELFYPATDGVHVVDGEDLAALATAAGPDYNPGACDFAPVPLAVLACPTTGEFGVDCSDEFGNAVAVGDIDGDGQPEILVGDPGARVADAPRAGAVHVFENPGTGWQRVGALFDASPSEDGRLGTVIVVARIADRDEPFVGAPGSGEVFAFYCSGLTGDSPNDDLLSGSGRLDETCQPPGP